MKQRINSHGEPCLPKRAKYKGGRSRKAQNNLRDQILWNYEFAYDEEERYQYDRTSGIGNFYIVLLILAICFLIIIFGGKIRP